MKKTYCDFCGAETNATPPVIALQVSNLTKVFDACDSCTFLFKTILDNPIPYLKKMLEVATTS